MVDIRNLLQKKEEDRTESDLDAIFKWMVRKDYHKTFKAILKDSKGFNAILRELGRHFWYREYDENEFVFHAGDYGDHWYCILTGKMNVINERRPIDGGDPILEVVGTLPSPEGNRCFGEVALSEDRGKRTKSIQASEPSDVLCLHRAPYHRILNNVADIDRYSVKNVK